MDIALPALRALLRCVVVVVVVPAAAAAAAAAAATTLLLSPFGHRSDAWSSRKHWWAASVLCDEEIYITDVASCIGVSVEVAAPAGSCGSGGGGRLLGVSE